MIAYQKSHSGAWKDKTGRSSCHSEEGQKREVGILKRQHSIANAETIRDIPVEDAQTNAQKHGRYVANREIDEIEDMDTASIDEDIESQWDAS